MLRLLKIRPRPFYNTRHTYISYMLAIGARPLWVARQTGTSLEMIEQHYGDARCSSGELDALISDAKRARTRNLPGTLDDDSSNDVLADEKAPTSRGLHPERATGVEPATSSLGMGLKRTFKTLICRDNRPKSCGLSRSSRQVEGGSDQRQKLSRRQDTRAKDRSRVRRSRSPVTR